MKTADPTVPAEAETCPVPEALQRRNARIYAAMIALTYLTAPVLYVGMVQAALFKRLNTSDALANLPSTLYLGMMWFPVLCAWWFPQAGMLRPLIRNAYLAQAAACALVAAALLLQAPPAVVIGVMLVHATVVGSANGVTVVLNWEVLGRAVSIRVRGHALALAFGWGPGLAVLGSLGAQLLLDSRLFAIPAPPWLVLPYPFNYAVLFGVAALTMALAAFLATKFTLPAPGAEPGRARFRAFALDGLRSVAGNRVLLIACAAYLLVFCGNMVQINMSLFTREAVGRAAEDLAGYQLALRFSFKMLAGFLLGWVLARTNPKVPLLVTIGLQIAGVLWVLLVPGYWFLLAFGINGAGELFGVYYINYPLACSRQRDVRRNLSALTLVSSLVGFAPLAYGWISDHYGLRTSFWAALVLLFFTTALVILKLPSQPKPPPAADDADLIPARA